MLDRTAVILLWFLPIALSLHVFEEFAFPGGLKQWIKHYKPEKPKSSFYYFIVNALGLVWAFFIAFKVTGIPTFRIYLYFVAIMGANAASHIRGTIQKKRYCPGTVTGGLLLLPLFIVSYWYSLNTGKVDLPSAIVCICVGFVIGFYVWGMDMRKKNPNYRLAILFVLLLLGVAIVRRLGDWQKAYYGVQLYQLKKQVLALERDGQNTRCARQILTETGWLLHYAPHDFERIAGRITALRGVLNDPASLSAPDEQSEIDGSWGRCYTEWFFKLDTSYDEIAALAEKGQVPRFPTRFLDRINSPEKLTNHFNHLLISDLKADGVDRRRELNETVADLMRLILRQQPKNYAYDPRLKAALLDWLLKTARNPDTGYWGPWYRRPTDGTIFKDADLSMTFHIVSYLKGNVPDWPKIIATTLANKNQKYPHGWLEESGYVNHHNMDVVQLFRLGWNQATPAQREAMRVEIRKMLHWCITESLQPDGSFKVQIHDDSLETSVHFGASFLARLGYFDRSKRFWTDEDFPEAAEVRTHIVQFVRAHIHSGGEGGIYYRDTLKEFGAPVSG
ncbi:MAG TPA: HXXEE domain-containing protein [Verrucomicrobiae bacterium]|nr:HXXEE domain-containing protein [Verrucomicrobiae bacterium]